MTAKTAAMILGVVLVLVGVLGFIPNPIVSPTGMFAVNTLHNVVHLVSGILLLAGAYMWLGAGFGASLALKILGIVYAVVAILGFVSPGLLSGLIMTNMADHWLHVALAVVLLAAGFML